MTPRRTDGRISAFHRLGQYTTGLRNVACCYAELTFLLTVAGIHFAYLWMDGQAELAWVAS